MARPREIERVRDGLEGDRLRADIPGSGETAWISRCGIRACDRYSRGCPIIRLWPGSRRRSLHDWRGEATLLPPRLTYELRPRYGPTVKWCDIPVTRVWRCGNRGNVASVLIEKPARGDFLPIVDGGFSLQYSPLMEYHEGRGLVLFCQLDVTGRSEPEPAAESLATQSAELRVGLEIAPSSERCLCRRSGREAASGRVGFCREPRSRRGISCRPGARRRARWWQVLASSAPAIARWLEAGGTRSGDRP